MREEYCVILTTVGSREEADSIAEALVTRRLAACVQVSPISSVYVWKGELHRDAEHLLLIKTPAECYQAVEAAIRENHSYEIPEIVQLPIERGLPEYLDWISAGTTRGT
ncbi:MAG TPA: divalent-cation tolerance protein CutA [Anaerolineales bacterium]|nr:divalent-cation tolerance protein CutA [Anaerolineales bacterium]